MLLEHILLVVFSSPVKALAIRAEREKFAYFSYGITVSRAYRHNTDAPTEIHILKDLDLRFLFSTPFGRRINIWP